MLLWRRYVETEGVYAEFIDDHLGKINEENILKIEVAKTGNSSAEWTATLPKILKEYQPVPKMKQGSAWTTEVLHMEIFPDP